MPSVQVVITFWMDMTAPILASSEPLHRLGEPVVRSSSMPRGVNEISRGR
jgi:hypothetical protein